MDAEVQVDAIRPQRMDTVRPLRLQQDRKLMGTAERFELAEIALAQRRKMTENQGHGIVTGSDLDLRDLATGVERPDQCRKGLDALPDFGQQGVADRKVRDEARVVFAKTDQGLALLVDPLDRQPALAAVAPGLVGQRRQPFAWRDLADALEVLGENALLGLDLPRRRQMLERAATALAEMRAVRIDTIGRS